MQGILHISRSWIDPVPGLRRSLALILAVLGIEAFFIYVSGRGIPFPPIVLQGAARLIDTAILLLAGNWSFRKRIPHPVFKESIGITIVFLTAQLIFLASWRGILGSPFLRMEHTLLSLDPVPLIAFYISSCFLSPVAEELVFRGLIYRWLRERLGFWVSAGIVSALFLLLHAVFTGQTLLPFAGSLLFCMGYEKNKFILTPILLHVFGNMLIFVSPYIPFL